MSFKNAACHFNSDVKDAFYLKLFVVMTLTIHLAKCSSNERGIEIEVGWLWKKSIYNRQSIKLVDIIRKINNKYRINSIVKKSTINIYLHFKCGARFQICQLVSILIHIRLWYCICIKRNAIDEYEKTFEFSFWI